MKRFWICLTLRFACINTLAAVLGRINLSACVRPCCFPPDGWQAV